MTEQNLANLHRVNGRKGAWRSRVREKIPLTNLGLVVVSLASLSYWGLGLPRVDYVIQLACIFALALVGMAFAFVLPGAVSLHRRLAALPPSQPVHFEAKRGYATLMRLPAMRWLPFIELSWDWVQPRGFRVNIEAQGGHFVEVVEAFERGQFEQVHRRFILEDPFGLVRVTLYRSQAQTLRVVPWKGLVENSPMLRAHAGGDELSHPAGEKIGDRIDIRRYQPGDPLKWVLWKIFARTGQMMVRTPEKAISPSVRVLAYLPCCENDEPAAAAARVAVGSQLLSTDWRFRADGATSTALDEETALDQIVRSRGFAGTPSAEASGLEAFLDADSEIGGSRLILFLPATPGPWLDTCLKAIARRDFPVTAVVCTDAVEDARAADQPRYERWLRRRKALSDQGYFSTTQEQLNEVIDRLAGAKIDVIGVERPNGRLLRTSTWQNLHGRQMGAA